MPKTTGMRPPRRPIIQKENARNTNETPKSLRVFAKTLRDSADILEDVAEKMDINGLNFINVFCGTGANEYLHSRIEPFVRDTKKKLQILGIRFDK